MPKRKVRKTRARRSKPRIKAEPLRMSKAIRPAYVHVVSTQDVPGFETREVKGLVWATTVRSKFVGKDILAVLRMIIGGEIPEYTEMINEAKRYVIEKLVENAKVLGANAVIGVNISTTSQVLPGAVEIYAYGTAVVIEK